MAETRKYRLLLSTGQQMVTVDERDNDQIRACIRRGLDIVCVTDAVHQADRQRWTVNGSHVVAWRPVR